MKLYVNLFTDKCDVWFQVKNKDKTNYSNNVIQQLKFPTHVILWFFLYKTNIFKMKLYI